MLQLHGSGKTAVLVERVIKKIINDKIDIDKLLIVTFTNAAASQMREKILHAIYEKLEKEPENSHLQRQTVLLNKASISTIHSFCLEVIRNYFYEIDLSPNFRVGDTSELELLKKEVIDDLFEDKYEKQDKSFEKLIECYTSYKGDEELKDLVFKIDTFIQSMPFPQKWLKDSVERFNVSKEDDFIKTIWGAVLIDNFREKANACYIELCALEKKLQAEGLDICAQIIHEDKMIVSNFVNIQSWDEAHEKALELKFSNWKSDKKIQSNLQEEAKIKRTSIKESFTRSLELIKIYSSQEAIEGICSMKTILESLKDLVLDFEEKYMLAKKEKNIIDFHDIEHFALEILEKPEIAKEYKEKFEEIAIDEYQDSNLIQDYLLNMISRGSNVFMVGDVKQSIYKFRGARPKLFIDKYETYGSNNGEGIKVLLYKNFRSRKEIIEITNKVFETIMSKKLGDIEYTKDEYLNCGATYEVEEDNDYMPELNTIDTKISEEDQDIEQFENSELEAKLVAKKIQKLMNNNFKIKDGDKYRNLKYRDIVILLRAPNDVAGIYEKELTVQGIPVYSDVSSVYLDSTEITTVLSLLKIIDNPNQDIPLVTVLRSPIYNFDDNELIQIRLNNKQGSFYEALRTASENAEEHFKEKINNFLNSINLYRKKQEYIPLNELIWYIYETTGYMSYLKLTTNGALKIANLKMLFERAKDYEKASFKGLYNFVQYIERMKKVGQDFGAAKIIGETEDVVRIMSIHKSKGLEFPVVFICQMGKSFNFRDLNEKVLLHQDMGLGPKYINYSRRIEYDTLAKEAIKTSSKQEEISEEMRVLYVGLTRAKEKLILIGVQKEVEKELEEKRNIIENYSEEKLPPEIIRQYKTYLDWLELVFLRNKLSIKIHSQNELTQQVKTQELEEKKMQSKLTKEEKENLRKEINWQYPNKELALIPSKLSVTAIKNLRIENKDSKAIECVLNTPNFISENNSLTGAQKGTIMHFIMQKLDLKHDYTRQELQDFINEMVLKRFIKEEEVKAINLDRIESFLNSRLAKDIKEAKKIFKEKPFYLSLHASEIYGGELQENIVVQGIIDLYYVDKNNKTVLVDYKTDYVENGKEDFLIEKYKEQIEIYKKAIEQATGQKVDRAYIYSMYLNKEILVT